MIRFDDVWKTYGAVQALAGLELEIAPGELRAILGPNGAGKTTLLSAISGLVSPDSGTVLVDGIDVRLDRRAARARIGMAPQELAVYPRATVRENLRLFGALIDIPRRQLAAEIDSLSGRLALDGLMDRRADALSGGEQRRLHTAIALLGCPPILLLDEPTVGADVSTRAKILERVKELHAAGTTVCYSTHYLAEVETLDASVTIVAEGRALLTGSPNDIITRAAIRTTARVTFVGRPPAVEGCGLVGRGDDWLEFELLDEIRTVGHVLAGLSEAADRVKAIDLTRPTFEASYLKLIRDFDRSSPNEVKEPANAPA